MKAYDLLFGDSPAQLRIHPTAQETCEQLSGAAPAGWSGGRAPAIGAGAWPHSPVTGHPMIHLLTVLVPQEYRRGNPEHVAVSLFQADDHVAHGDEEMLELARQGSRHRAQVDLLDEIGGAFALIPLTQNEFDGPRQDPPRDVRPDHQRDVGGMNAWDDTQAECPVWLAERAGDPNAGKTPIEFPGPEDEYLDLYDAEDPALREFQEKAYGRSHFGGTTMCLQGVPAGLTPYYLELEDEVGGANFGGGNARLDLDRGEITWDC